MQVVDYNPQNKIHIQIFIHINKYINKGGEGTVLSYIGIPVSLEEGNENHL